MATEDGFRGGFRLERCFSATYYSPIDIMDPDWGHLTLRMSGRPTPISTFPTRAHGSTLPGASAFHEGLVQKPRYRGLNIDNYFSIIAAEDLKVCTHEKV